MEQLSIQDLSAPRAESFEPPPSEHPIHTSSYELSPTLIDLVQRTCSFSGSISENPYTHLQEFDHICACYAIVSMSHYTLRWKLFHFSLMGDAKQWCNRNIGRARCGWDVLVSNFCQKYFPPSCIITLQRDILGFQHGEETLCAACERFSHLVKSCPILSIPEHVTLQHFYMSLNKESASRLDMTSGGSFSQKSTTEG
jgi:hypothetical protein